MRGCTSIQSYNDNLGYERMRERCFRNTALACGIDAAHRGDYTLQLSGYQSNWMPRGRSNNASPSG